MNHVIASIPKFRRIVLFKYDDWSGHTGSGEIIAESSSHYHIRQASLFTAVSHWIEKENIVETLAVIPPKAPMLKKIKRAFNKLLGKMCL